MMNNVTKKKWKSLVAIAKTAKEFSGKTGDSYDGRGYFPNKNMSTAVAKSIHGDAKMQGKALVTKMESQYDNEANWNKGTRYLNVPEKMIKHKNDVAIKKSGKANFINTENKMKYIFGESKMKKSDFNTLVQSIISEVIDVLTEGKGSAPGLSSPPATPPAIPGQVSKGGFSLKDFGSVLGGIGGAYRVGGKAGTSREKLTNPAAGDAGAKAEKRLMQRQIKLTLFGREKSIDAWRTEMLGGYLPEPQPGEKYQRRGADGKVSGYKTKASTSLLDSLASIRNADESFRKSGGGRKPGGRESFKVHSKYIGQKNDAIKMYDDVVDGQIAKLREIQDDADAGDKNYVALENLIEDLELKKDEYTLKWDYATAAYSGNVSTMAAVRSNIEAKRDVIERRAKAVGEGGSASPWKQGASYNWGDKVTGSDGVVYTAKDDGKGQESLRALSEVDPIKGAEIWEAGEGGAPANWERNARYEWGDRVTAEDGQIYIATDNGKDPEEDLGDDSPLDNDELWKLQK